MMDDEILTLEKKVMREEAGLRAYYARELEEMMDVAEDNEPSDDEEWEKEPKMIPRGKIWDPITESLVIRRCIDDFDEKLKRQTLRRKWSCLMAKRREDRGNIPAYWLGDSELDFSDFEEQRTKRRKRT